ncbi:MAG: hypothetical protein M3Z01_03135 [Thermoproteota archaeon]|nr:hypothetical protein [Thermoproteota archaeon]
MEEVLDGLYRWFDKSLSLDWLDESHKILELKGLLKNVKTPWTVLLNYHILKNHIYNIVFFVMTIDLKS